jgi:hypothetical protein
MVDLARIQSLKKRINKEIPFLEITSSKDPTCPGFTFSGLKEYKTGGKAKFDFNIAEIVEDMQITDFRGIKWQYLVQIDAQKFKDNVDFLDDNNEFIAITIHGKNIYFQGIRETGQKGEIISHELDNSDVPDKFEALFQKKQLKIVTHTRELNKMLNIAYNNDGIIWPVHFFYEMDQAQQRSVFSTILIPSCGNKDD